MSIGQIVSKYRFRMIARRWLALWFDGVVMLGFITIPALTLTETLYQNLIWLWIAILFSYLFVLEGLKGWTLGKLIMRIRVVDVHGKPIGLLRAFLRNLIRIIEANPILFGGGLAGIVALISKKRQRFGDMAAGSYVVKRDDIPKITPPEETAEPEPSFTDLIRSIQVGNPDPAS